MEAKQIAPNPAQILTLYDCVCRNKRHRLEAKRQARAFLQNWMLTPQENNDAHTLGKSKESLFLETLQLKGKKVCRRCSLIYLQQLENAHGEQIAQYAISFLCPPV